MVNSEIYLPFLFRFLVTHSSALINLGFGSRILISVYGDSFEQEYTFHNIFDF